MEIASSSLTTMDIIFTYSEYFCTSLGEMCAFLETHYFYAPVFQNT